MDPLNGKSARSEPAGAPSQESGQVPVSVVHPSRLLQLLLEAEGEGGLGELEFTPYRLSMWAYVRWMLVAGISDGLNDTDWGSRLSEDHTSLVGKATYVLQTLRNRHRPALDRGFPIMFFCSGVGNYLEDGAYVNRLTDGFAGCFREETLLVEDSARKQFRLPRRFPNVAYHDPILLRAFAHGKLHRESAEDRAAIDGFVQRLVRLFGDHLTPRLIDRIRAKLLKTARQCRAWRRAYLALFAAVRPRLVLIEDGCYGARSHIIRWAREQGIATAEYQHGYVGSNHEAYNYDARLLAGRYRDNFPDFFLTFGRHWGAQVNIPSERVLIGNPHLTEVRATMTRRRRGRAALFVSGGLSVPLYQKVLPEISAGLPADVELIFRPHPLERDSMDAYGDVFVRHGISVDVDPVAYQSVIDADLIIGDASTLLFEAVAFEKPVVVIDYEESRKNIPAGLFPFVSDFSTLAGFMDRDRAGSGAATANADLWAPGWRENYQAFVGRVLGRSPGRA